MAASCSSVMASRLARNARIYSKLPIPRQLASRAGPLLT
jgi:hypothetical protein